MKILNLLKQRLNTIHRCCNQAFFSNVIGIFAKILDWISLWRRAGEKQINLCAYAFGLKGIFTSLAQVSRYSEAPFEDHSLELWIIQESKRSLREKLLWKKLLKKKKLKKYLEAEFKRGLWEKLDLSFLVLQLTSTGQLVGPIWTSCE